MENITKKKTALSSRTASSILLYV